MGIDIGDLWGQAKDAIGSGVQQVEDQGVPALTAAAETWGANVLTGQAQQNQAALNTAIQKAPAAAPGSFQAALQGTFTSALTSKTGPTIILCLVGAFLAYTLFLKD